MNDSASIQGDLQAQIMPVLWRLEEGTVEQVRTNLPRRYRSAYNTVQTVLNRLSERGLLERDRRGNAMVYRPRMSETDYLARTVESTLAGASSEARQAVLVQLLGGLEGAELTELQALAQEIDRHRDRDGS